MAVNEAGRALGSSPPGSASGEPGAAAGASPGCLSLPRCRLQGHWALGEKGNGKGDQEVAKPLAIIPLFNTVKDRICRVIPVGKDLWTSLV